MSKITITLIVSFIVALAAFLIHSEINSTVQDSMLDATGNVVEESNLNEDAKSSMSGVWTLIGLASALSFIMGLLALIKKFFG